MDFFLYSLLVQATYSNLPPDTLLRGSLPSSESNPRQSCSLLHRLPENKPLQCSHLTQDDLLPLLACAFHEDHQTSSRSGFQVFLYSLCSRNLPLNTFLLFLLKSSMQSTSSSHVPLLLLHFLFSDESMLTNFKSYFCYYFVFSIIFSCSIFSLINF